MTESVLKTLDDVMFIQGETPVTQENWQKYFGGALPNGIYEGFAPTSARETPVSGITGGTVVHNGLVYKMANALTVDSEILESEGYRFISLRIYPDTGVAKIVETRGNAPVASDETILNGIIQATQNPIVSSEDFDHNTYVEYRLLYQGHKNSLYKAGVDLRQTVLMRRGRIPTSWNNYWTNYYANLEKIMLSGDQIVNITYSGNWSLDVWLDPMNPPDNARVTTNAKYVYFHEYPAILDVKRSSAYSPEYRYGMKDEFRNVLDCFGTNWTRKTAPVASQIYNPPVTWEYHDATPETPFVIQYRGQNSNNQNMFLIQMPTTGAQTEWGLVEGTLSNQQDLQDALDAKADATAVYTKTEADTRMYSKSETDALLDAKANASDVYSKSDTDEIVSAFYSKQETDALLDAKVDSADVYEKTETYTKAETDALLDAKADSTSVYAKTETYTKSETDALLSPKANSADVYAKSETYSKSEAYSKTEVDTALGDKANSSSVYTKSETDTLLSNKEDKSALGTFAYKSSLSYDSITNKPTLGTLAGKNKASLSSDVTDILPISKGGTGASSTNQFYNNVFASLHKQYYVSLSGNDTNDGSVGSPFRSIGKAIEMIGYRNFGVIDLVDEDGTFYEDRLSFSDATNYLIVSRNARIIPESFMVKYSSLRIMGAIRITTDAINVQFGQLIQDYSMGNNEGLTIDGGLLSLRSFCFLSDVISNTSGNAFYADGGIITYESLTGTFANIGTAKNGGIISTGNGNIFSWGHIVS